MKKYDGLWLLVLVGIILLLVDSTTHKIFVNLTTQYPYTGGFSKFLILATMGELLAIRIVTGAWKLPKGLAYRAVIWGIIGMAVVLMFGVLGPGMSAAMAKGLLPGDKSPFLLALFISSIMNLTFGPTLMICHRLTDTYLDIMYEKPTAQVTWSEVVQRIDWDGLVSFVLFKTIPFFWIPAHTIIFLLPPEYRVLGAAMLSIALGSILAFSKRKSQASVALSVK